jgi:uncharacterized protein (DUF1800 family)
MAAAALPPLEKLDPAEAWKPWKPDAKDPWDLRWAGHLYRRAAFGAGLRELRQAVAEGLPATLDRLFAGDPGAGARWQQLLLPTGKQMAGKNNPASLRNWWLYTMLHSLHPMREKLTLFWHDHFATSIAKVGKAPLMFKQNLTLREHALGKFGDFLQAMSKDPAMLLWLDSNSNVKGKPNENYAREVMELFSLGVHSGYTEKDIREAARAFTGWQVDDDTYAFKTSLHDDGTKTVLGKTGNWNGEDVVKICLDQPACARFLVRKLYRYLVNESQVPPDSLIEPLAESFRKSDYDIKALVRTMLSSRHFYSAHAYRQKIKSPAEYVVGAVWALTNREIQQGSLINQLEAMGQTLFAPPNVKGWPGGTAWLNTSTILARHNFAHAIAAGNLRDTNRYTSLSPREAAIERERELAEEQQRLLEEKARDAEEARLKAEGKPVPPRPVPKTPPLPPPPANMDVATLVHYEKVTTPEAIVGVLLDLLLQGGIADSARAKLIAFIKDGAPKGPAPDRRIREAAHTIMTMPEYQLC